MWDRKTTYLLYYLPEGSQYKMKYSALQWFMVHSWSKPHTDKHTLLLLHNSHQLPQLTLSLRVQTLLSVLLDVTSNYCFYFTIVHKFLFSNVSHNKWMRLLAYTLDMFHVFPSLCISSHGIELLWVELKLSNLGTNSKM